MKNIFKDCYFIRLIKNKIISSKMTHGSFQIFQRNLNSDQLISKIFERKKTINSNETLRTFITNNFIKF